jgi:hypothetical protein
MFWFKIIKKSNNILVYIICSVSDKTEVLLPEGGMNAA